MHEHEELLGADFFEHDIRHPGVGVSRAVSVLKNYHDEIDPTIVPKGKNVGHDIIIEMKNKKIQEETYKPVSRNQTKF